MFKTRLIGAMILIAGLVVFAKMGNLVMRVSADANITAKALVDHECDTQEWHFVITGITGGVTAPSSITVTWANGQSEVVSLDGVTGHTAHYRTTSYLNSNVVEATAVIGDGWDGQFNLSHGPCGQEQGPTPTPTPTPTQTPTLTPTQTPTPTSTLTPTQTPTPTPTPTDETQPTPTPTPTERPSCDGECVIIVGELSPTPTLTSTPTSTPTPTPGPTATPTPGENSNGGDDGDNTDEPAIGGGVVLGASTESTQGQVLGYADTGTWQQTAEAGLAFMGFLMMVAGGIVIHYAKETA